MPRHILLPTDFSDNAWSAAVYVLKLFAAEPCTFYFLHSSKMKISAMSNMSNKLVRVMAENAKRDLNELKDLAKNANANANHDFEVILSTYDLQDAIETVVQKYTIDCIVMGTKGATNAKERIFGSQTSQIIKKIKSCPVMAVPDEFDFVKPGQIAFPTDFNRNYGDDLLPLKHLADLYDSKIRIVHVNKEDALTQTQNQNIAQLKVALEDYQHSFHWMPDYGTVERAIKDFVEELDINILVMVNYKHSFIARIIREPVVNRIGFQPSVPFFVIPCLI